MRRSDDELEKTPDGRDRRITPDGHVNNCNMNCMGTWEGCQVCRPRVPSQPGSGCRDLNLRMALEKLLNQIGSWTSSRFDQHVRHEFGDETAEDLIAWLNHFDINPKSQR